MRIDARSWQVHLARVGLMLAIYVSLVSTLATSLRFGAPGLGFFTGIVWLNVSFMTLLGIGFFSTAVSEEKEEDTLGLMQMAGIIPLGILLGKIGGRLFQALLLIAVQYPFTLLAITMGGVTSAQVRCAFAGLTAFMLLLAGLGLLCSTVAPRNRTASGLMTLGLLIYVAIPYSAGTLLQYLVSIDLFPRDSLWGMLLTEISSVCLPLQIPSILASTFGESLWSTQVISNVVVAAVCFLASWALFSRCTRDASTEAVSRGLLAHKTSRFRWLAPGRPRFNPFLWKDFHFVGGGYPMIVARFLFYLALFGLSILLSEIWWGQRGWQGQFPMKMAIKLYQSLLLFIITLETAILMTRTLHEEVRGQTLAALVMLPESLTAVVYSKLAGTLLAGLPGIVCMACACLMTKAGQHHTSEFFEVAAGWFFLSHFVLVPHLSMVLAMYMRWGCVPLGIGGGIGAISICGWYISTFGVGPNDSIVWFTACFLFLVSIACHFWVVRRLPIVAVRG